jgi:hypothetical protein
MMIGAKITLNSPFESARDALGGLAGESWLFSIPHQHWGRGGHPAGSALPGQTCLVAVAFGNLAATSPSTCALPVRWESLEPGDRFTVVLDADIILVPGVDQAADVLVLAGVCRLPGMLDADGHEHARTSLSDAAKSFITSVAGAVLCAAAPGPQAAHAGQAMSWLSELPGSL